MQQYLRTSTPTWKPAACGRSAGSAAGWRLWRPIGGVAWASRCPAGDARWPGGARGVPAEFDSSTPLRISEPRRRTASVPAGSPAEHLGGRLGPLRQVGEGIDMKLVTCAVLIGLSGIALAADQEQLQAKPASVVNGILVRPAKSTDDPARVAAIAKVIEELKKAGTDPAKVTEAIALADRTGVEACVLEVGGRCVGITVHNPAEPCYFMRMVRPLPGSSEEDALLGPRFMPLQSRAVGSEVRTTCDKGNGTLKAVK